MLDVVVVVSSGPTMVVGAHADNVATTTTRRDSRRTESLDRDQNARRRKAIDNDAPTFDIDDQTVVGCSAVDNA